MLNLKPVILNRIDESGVFALPGGVTFDQVKVLLHNSTPIHPEQENCVILDSEKVDVIESNEFSAVMALITNISR